MASAPSSAASRASAVASSPGPSSRVSIPSRPASATSSSAVGEPEPERGLTRRKGRELNSAFDGVQRPGGPDADQVPVGICEVVDLGPEARARHPPALDPLALEAVDLARDVLAGELEARAPADLAAPLRIPGEHEEGQIGRASCRKECRDRWSP